MNDAVKENAEEIAKIYMETQKTLDGTNICMSGDIYLRKMQEKVSALSDNSVGLIREVNNSNIHRGTYNIYLMCDPDIYDEIIQYTDEVKINE